MINAGRIIVNSPGSIGALGGVYNDMVPTFSFGCGTGGGNSTTDNVNVFHYLNIKRVARRTQAHMWFRVPNQIYFNMNAVENLRNFPSRSTLIITNAPLEQLGHVDIVKRCIPPETQVRVTIIPDAEPDIKIIMQGVEALNFYKADQIIALGGGSVIDAAKIMKLKYEFPEADLEELAAPFLDLRKRVVQYPTEKTNHARLIAISTTSGTGSEVTPFAVMTDKERGFKVTLADYSLTPDVAIVDPQFVMSMPRGLTVDTGIDCLTHALEAGVSIFASPYTDSNAMQAVRMTFKYLPIAVRASQRRRGAHHDAQRGVHRGDCVLECVGGREPCAGACLWRALRRAARPGQCADAAARDRLQRGGADEVHAIAEPAGLRGAQEVRHDGRPAWTGRTHGRREGAEPGRPRPNNCSISWACRGRSPSWASRRKSSRRRCLIWRRSRSTIRRGARIRACRWSKRSWNCSGPLITDAAWPGSKRNRRKRKSETMVTV